MRPVLFFLGVVFVGLAAHTHAQSSADSAAIRKAALNYVEGWYEADADRMESALHPELAKRIVLVDEKTGKNWLDMMGASRLVSGTRRGGGKNTPKDQQQKDVSILDIFGNTASVKAIMSGWIDYMHLAKWNGEWKIVNVLWEYKPKK
ncbi:MAG: nuclear transport factor 2 family protein [Ignavibacteriales bacterium]|nr:nuclear transport factor 2 family protein [Ignavibacteriales bacterium]